MARGPVDRTIDHMMAKRIPLWMYKAMEDVTMMDMIRAVSLWKTLRGRAGHKKPIRTCGWCDQPAMGGQCDACRKAEMNGWAVAMVKKRDRRPEASAAELTERVLRIERALFLDDGIGRVEDGPFAPDSIREMMKAGAAAEQDQLASEKQAVLRTGAESSDVK